MIQINTSLRKILFTSLIDPDSVTSLMVSIDSLIQHIKEKEEFLSDITIVINSPGGRVDSALGIVDYIEDINNDKDQPIKINTLGFGEVSSAACLLISAGRNIKFTPRTRFMWHTMRTFAFGEMSTAKMSNNAEDMKEVAAECRKIIASRFKLTDKQLLEMEMSGLDHHYFGHEMTELLRKQPDVNERVKNPDWVDPKTPVAPVQNITVHNPPKVTEGDENEGPEPILEPEDKLSEALETILDEIKKRKDAEQ